MDVKMNDSNKVMDELILKITLFTGVTYPFLAEKGSNFKNEHKNSTIFLMETLKRLTVNSMSLSILFERYKFIPEIEHSIGLILRSSLQDVMHLLYFKTKHTSNDKLNIIELEKDKPNPAPSNPIPPALFGLLVKNGSKQRSFSSLVIPRPLSLTCKSMYLPGLSSAVNSLSFTVAIVATRSILGVLTFCRASFALISKFVKTCCI